MPIPPNAVSVHLDDGEARMTVQDMAIPDYFSIPNALFRFEDPPPNRRSARSTCTGAVR